MPKREIHGIYVKATTHAYTKAHSKKITSLVKQFILKKKRKEKNITQYENEQITLSLMAIYYKPLITF